MWNKQKITDDFRKIIIKNGAVAIGVLPTNINYSEAMKSQEAEKFNKILNLCDGFILQGWMAKERDESHHIYDRNYRHDIIIDETSRLYKLLGNNKKVKVNRIYNVMIKDSVVNHFDIIAHDSNGFVEAVELKNKKFCLGLKWHPEIMDNDDIMENILKNLLNPVTNIIK